MSISSINSNTAALSAALNISNANTATANDVSALSSGNRLVNASTDVAALAAGTALISQVNTLNAALSNTTQGSSLLQVADGALSQIQSILQRQQAIAVSAQSGSLSDTQRGFLDQEFQQLTQEIDQLAQTTNFNGVNLIDGSLSGGGTGIDTAGIGAAQSAVVAGVTTNSQLTSSLVTLTNTGATTDDSAFYGALSGGTFSVTATGGAYNISYTINGETYTKNAQAGSASAAPITLTGGAATLAITAITGATVNAANALTLQNNLNAGFSTGTAYAEHFIASTDATNPNTGVTELGTSIATVKANGSNYTLGTALAGLSGADFKLQSASLNGTQLPSIGNFSATTDSGSLSTLSVVIDGNTYTTAGVTSGTDIKADTFGTGAAGQAVFYLNGDTTSNAKFTIDFATNLTNTIDTSNQVGVNTITSTLDSLFSGNSGQGISFQVGSTSATSISVSIGSATSNALFGGVAQNVQSQSSAATAGNAVTTALNTITALRATVGADEERFNFASNAISSAVQNEGAAQSALLDTDVATTSTTFATNQVQLQAGIAVLAQANQLQQNLLKLIA